MSEFAVIWVVTGECLFTLLHHRSPGICSCPSAFLPLWSPGNRSFPSASPIGVLVVALGFPGGLLLQWRPTAAFGPGLGSRGSTEGGYGCALLGGHGWLG